MHKPLFLLAAAGLLLASQTAGADEASVRKAFVAKFPKAEVHSVTKLPYLGLYEIIVEGEVLYADDNFDYLIDGNIISTKNHEQPDRAEEAQALGDSVHRAAARARNQEGQGQRRAQDGGVLRSRLPILQARRGRPGQARQRHDLHVPLPDRVPAPQSSRRGQAHLVLAGQGSRPGTTTCCGASPPAPTAAARIRWTRSSTTARRRGSTARPRWCSRAALAYPVPFLRRRSRAISTRRRTRGGGPGAARGRRCEDARSRLALAVVASAVLHWVLMYGVTVRAPEPSIPPLIGRLQPEPSRPRRVRQPDSPAGTAGSCLATQRQPNREPRGACHWSASSPTRRRRRRKKYPRPRRPCACSGFGAA